jgi:mannosyl-3-phosphoglycerate phosphatase
MRILIFTDLDGSLLDHGDYSFEEARPALEHVNGGGWPLIMVTSKTRPEVVHLQAQLGISQPFVVENGAGIFFPPSYAALSLPDPILTEGLYLVRLGTSYDAVRRFLEELPPELSVVGFGDMTEAEIQEATGFSPQRARMARAREFTEPFLPVDEDKASELMARAAARGLKIIRGGRFFHLVGDGQDKGKAVTLVRDLFQAYWDEACITIGLGDSLNDLPMLEVVEIPILIPNPHGRPPDIGWDRLVRAPHPGSRGWGEALLEVLHGIVQAG